MVPSAAQAQFPASFDLSTLDGTNGFVLIGMSQEDFSGLEVSGAGDINGDGFDDVIIGAYNAAPNGNRKAGESYVVFGKNSGFPASVELSSLDGSNGFVINGASRNDKSGLSVSGAGDVNGDGLSDVIISAIGATPNGKNSGESYVVFGNNSGFPASVELSSLDGSNGFVINGIEPYDVSGRSVSDAGDVNGDGFDDIIIGAYGADPNGIDKAGESYVVFGNNSGSASLDLSTLDGSNGFTIKGIDANDYSGRSVGGAGDVNGDGYDDLIIGAWNATPNGNRSGESYVVFGNSSGVASLDLSALDGTNGFVLNGVSADDWSGISVSGAGDVNGDGLDDVIVGASLARDIRAGESYVVFGKDIGFSATIDLGTLDGTNGFAIKGIDSGDHTGRGVSGAGDVNGDGIDDVIIGAYGADLVPNRLVPREGVLAA